MQQSLDTVLWCVTHSPFLPLRFLEDQYQQQKMNLFLCTDVPCSTLGSYKAEVAPEPYLALLPSRGRKLLSRTNNMVINLRRCLDNHVHWCHYCDGKHKSRWGQTSLPLSQQAL